MAYLVKIDWTCGGMGCNAEATQALFTQSHQLYGRFCDQHAASYKAMLDEREDNPKVLHMRPPPAADKRSE